MPYIASKVQRRLLRAGQVLPETPGELNYAITVLCLQYLKSKGLNYENLNSVHGALDCASRELYRRITAPYEDSKVEENGDLLEFEQMEIEMPVEISTISPVVLDRLFIPEGKKERKTDEAHLRRNHRQGRGGQDDAG